MLGRQAKTTLTPDGHSLTQFERFVLTDTIVPNMRKYLEHYNPDLAFHHYIDHVKDTDAKKAEYYLKAYNDFKAGGTDPCILEVFAKVDEWFAVHNTVEFD